MHGRKLEYITRLEKRELRQWFGNEKDSRFPKSLYGHCSYADGAYAFAWERRKDDFYVSLETDKISKTDYKKLQELAKMCHKSLYIHFHIHDRGFVANVLSFCLTNVASFAIWKLLEFLMGYFKGSFTSVEHITQSEKKSTINLIGNEMGEKGAVYSIDLESNNKNQTVFLANELGKKFNVDVLYYDKNGKKIEPTTTKHDVDFLA